MKKGFANTPVILTLKGEGSRNGFTLMELLVYMMIVGIIVIVAGQAFSNSTKFRVRTQNMLKATQEAENVATLFKADVSQMGAKSSKEATVAGGEDSFEKYTNCTSSADCIYMDPNNATTNNKDSSSYAITNKVTGKYDSIAFLRIRYNDQGKYQALEKVEWYVENEVLKRSCRLMQKISSLDANGDPCSNGPNSTPTPVEIASGVKKFTIIPGLPSIRSNASTGYTEEQIFPPGGGESFKFLSRYGEADYVMLSVLDNGSSSTLSGFKRNYDLSDATINTESKQMNQVFAATNEDLEGDWKDRCYKFKLEPGIEYEISFEMPYPTSVDDMTQLFVPGRDHMSVGFRDINGERPATINDFLFYPPTSNQSAGKRAMRFTVPDTLKNQCMAFTFSTYSPKAAEGTVTISNLKLRRVASSIYNFNSSITLPIKDKKNVKALKMSLQIARGGKKDQSGVMRAGETGEIEMVIPTPSNGPRD